MAAGIVGNSLVVAVGPSSPPWGEGDAPVFGAGDGLSVVTFDGGLGQGQAANDATTGYLDAPPTEPGARKPDPSVSYYLCYSGKGLVPLAAVQGAETVETVAAGVYLHRLVPATSYADVAVALAALYPGSHVAQLAHCKPTGATITFDQGPAATVVQAPYAAFDLNINQGGVDDDLIVVSTALANGTLTLAAQPPLPQHVTVTLAGPPTEAVVTIEAVDEWGAAFSHVHTFSVDGLTGTTPRAVDRVVAVRVSGVVGTGTVSIGVSDGIGNTIATMSNVTTDENNRVLFRHMRCWLTEQSKAGAFDDGDLMDPATLTITRELSVDDRVTAEFGDRRSEPVVGGGGRATLTVALSFGIFTSDHRKEIYRRRAMKPMRMLIEAKGPWIGTTGYQETIWIYLQGLQATSAEVPMTSMGGIPFDLEMSGSVVGAVPTGWPAGIVQPFYVAVQNGTAGLILA